MTTRIGRTIPPAAAPIPLKDIARAVPACFSDTQGSFLFEDELKGEYAQRYCLLVSSGKAALVLILRALKRLYPDRNEVIVPAFTCYSVPAAVKKAGLKVKLCDTEAGSLDLDPFQLRQLVETDRAEKKVLCVLATHMFGCPADMPGIKAIVGDDIPIVEDAAQAMGGNLDHKKLGTLADAGFFSLGRGKAFIIDEAEMLEADGQNVLLKTLEEPPAGTLIILVTSSADRLLPTIRSRCQRVSFTPLSEPEMAQWVQSSLDVADPAERTWIASFAEGSPGLARVAAQHSLHAWSSEIAPMLDQMVSGAFPAKFADRVSELASGVAEAAGRRAMSLCFSVMGRTVRERIGAHVRGAPAPGSLEAWSALPPLIAEAERTLRSNVAPKFALSAFVSSAIESGR